MPNLRLKFYGNEFSLEESSEENFIFFQHIMYILGLSYAVTTILYLFWWKPTLFFKVYIQILLLLKLSFVLMCLAKLLPIVVKPLTLQSLILFLFVHWKRYFMFLHYQRSLSSAKTWSNMKMDISLWTWNLPSTIFKCVMMQMISNEFVCRVDEAFNF